MQFRAHFKHNLLYHTEKCSNTWMQRENAHNLRSFEAMTQKYFIFIYDIYSPTAPILMRWCNNNKAKASGLRFACIAELVMSQWALVHWYQYWINVITVIQTHSCYTNLIPAHSDS
jgi:hypothetical protein